MEFLFKEELQEKTIKDFPQTRYQGSKFKLLQWIWDSVSFLDFHSVADLFGGTGSVAYLFKTKGFKVTYNDILKANYQTGLGFIENNDSRIPKSLLEQILNSAPPSNNGIISKNFEDIYFTSEENVWLDKIVQNIFYCCENDTHRQAVLFWALFQACIIKRPFNLFHRKNLYMRLKEVQRSFGNKTTWDKSFEYFFIKFIKEANRAIFDNGTDCRAINENALALENKYDLVYIDTPYISQRGVGVDYHHFYHFLEGISDYYNWENNIDFTRKHHPLKTQKNPWNDRSKIKNAFRELIANFKDSHLAISYRNDGIPAIDELLKIVSQFKKNYKLEKTEKYKYVLSTNGNSHEVLIIAWD